LNTLAERPKPSISSNIPATTQLVPHFAMDPVTAVGLLATIIQVIDATATAVQYLNDVRKAPNDRARLAQEATNLLYLLTTMRYEVEKANTADPWFNNIHSLGAVNGPLDQFKEVMEDLARKLYPESRLKKFAKDFIWSIDKKECSEILTKIERFKTLILLARQEDSLSVLISQLVELGMRFN
jgi:hypothetical protein